MRELTSDIYLNNMAKYAKFAGSFSSQMINAAQGNGFSFSIGTDLFAPIANINHQDLFTFTLGGRNNDGNLFNGNMNFAFGGGGISLSTIGNMADASQFFQNSNFANFVSDNGSSHEGRTTMMLYNSGFASQTQHGTNFAMNLGFGGLQVHYGTSQKDGQVHHGQANPSDNSITLSDEALSIGIGDYSSAGYWTGVAGRENFLVGLHNALGTGDWSYQEMQESGLALSFSGAAVQVQSSIANGYANEMEFQYNGEEADWQNRIDYAAATGDMSGFDNTGRDLYYIYYDQSDFSKQAFVQQNLENGIYGSHNVKMVPINISNGNFNTQISNHWNNIACKDKTFLGATFIFHGNDGIRMYAGNTGIVTDLDKLPEGKNPNKYMPLSNLLQPQYDSNYLYSFNFETRPTIKLLPCTIGNPYYYPENFATKLAEQTKLNVIGVNGYLSFDADSYMPRLFTPSFLLNAFVLQRRPVTPSLLLPSIPNFNIPLYMRYRYTDQGVILENYN